MISLAGITMLRRGESYTKGAVTLTPYMISANAFIEFEQNNVLITLNRHEFECLRKGIHKIKDYFDLCKLVVMNETDQVDIPYPSPSLSNNLLELSTNCFFLQLIIITIYSYV